MSSKRDLVEAHSFSRRRLVTAFVSGAPGGREVEPVRSGRLVVGGVAIAVLLVAGAAIAGVIKPRTPADWLEGGVVIAKETGADYAILEKGQPLRPLVNATSAQLLFGTELAPRSVAQKEIDKQEIGDPIGIYGAPDALPTADRLVGTGWTACTNGHRGTMFRIDSSPDATRVTGQAVLVENTTGDQFLVVVAPEGGFRLALPPEGPKRAGVMNSVSGGALGISAIPVTPDWLDLFPEGPALAASSFPASGSGPAPYAAQVGNPDLRVGDLARYADGRTYLAGNNGLVPLTEFALSVHRAVASARGGPKEIDNLEAEVVALPPRWPEANVERFADDQVCALLDAEPGEAATVSLGTVPDGSPATAGTMTNKVMASVESGLGAYVLSGGHFDSVGGQPVVVDSQGTRYRLGGEEGATAGLLGYDDYEPPTVPDAWLERYACGPELSAAAAAQPPDPGTSCLGL